MFGSASSRRRCPHRRGEIPTYTQGSGERSDWPDISIEGARYEYVKFDFGTAAGAFDRLADGIATHHRTGAGHDATYIFAAADTQHRTEGTRCSGEFPRLSPRAHWTTECRATRPTSRVLSQRSHHTTEESHGVLAMRRTISICIGYLSIVLYTKIYEILYMYKYILSYIFLVLLALDGSRLGDMP